MMMLKFTASGHGGEICGSSDFAAHFGSLWMAKRVATLFAGKKQIGTIKS